MSERYNITNENRLNKKSYNDTNPSIVGKTKLIYRNANFENLNEIKLSTTINIYKESTQNITEIEFDNCILNSITLTEYSNVIKLTIKKSIVISRITVKNKNMDELNLEDSTIHGKVKIQECDIKTKTNFYNTKFKELADFYRTKFNEVVFKRTDFEKIAVFSEAEFSSDVDFKYTKFLGKSIFRDTVIKGKLNLRDTIFNDEATFLDITSENRRDENGEFHGEPKAIQVANRETARIIKNFYDKSNNILEANKFYALEMKERKKELNFKSNFSEWIVFYLHGVSSNYSQSWGLALFWIVLLSTLYTYEINGLPFMTLFVSLTATTAVIEYSFKKNTTVIKCFDIGMPSLFVFIIFSSMYFYLETWSKLASTKFLNEIVKNINLFSKFDEKDITVWFFIYKVLLSYLIYQFIVSVRQNTRRK